MAREPFWDRDYIEYANGGTKAASHVVPLSLVLEGYTVTRIRLNWQAIHTPSIAASEGTGFMVCMGIVLLPVATDPTTVAHPAAPGQTPWMWWEAPLYQPVTVTSPEHAASEVDLVPAYDTYRDVRSQRTATEDSTLWLLTESTDSAPSQTSHYLCASWSVLQLFPAV